jgi:hypothetical protein
MLTLWIITVIFVGGPHGHLPTGEPGVHLTAGRHHAVTGAHGRASFRVRAGTYTLKVAHCGTIHGIRVHLETTRTRVRCSIR